MSGVTGAIQGGVNAAAQGATMAAMGSTLVAQGAATNIGIQGALQSATSQMFNSQVDTENRVRQAEAQAEADTFNAKVARQSAESETDRVAAEAVDYRKTQRAKLSSAVARRSASGFAMEGSPMMVDESIFGEIEFGGSRIAHAGQVIATRLRNQAELLDMAAKRSSDTASFARAAGSQSLENIREAGRLAAKGVALRGGVAMAQTTADIVDRAGRAATGLAQGVSAPRISLSGRDPGGANDWGLTSNDNYGMNHGLSSDLGGLAW